MNKKILSTGIVLFATLALSVFSSCSTRKLMVAEMTDLMETGAAAMESDDDLDMLQQALPANIKLMEALLASDPRNERLLVLLARLYGSYTFLFLDGRIEATPSVSTGSATDAVPLTSLKDSAVRYYGKAMDYALRALEVRHPLAGELLQKVADAGPFIQSLQTRDLPALFWYGFNLSGLINHRRDSVAVVARGHLFEKSMQRVLQLQADYYHGSAHLILMAFYASRSPLMGGNLGYAREHYRQLKAMHGDSLLLPDLFYARYVLVQQQDRSQFEQLLTAIQTSADPDPRFRLLNHVARQRSSVYLSMADRLFEGS